jgi:hypothetical protein
MKTENFNRRIAQLLIAAVFTTFCGISELAEAQAAQAQQSTPAESQPAGSGSAQNNAPTGTVDPSAGPLAPVPSTQQQLPNAPSELREEPAATPPPQRQQPLGTAGAEVGPTAGGLAAKPAGNAIAPAKQHQVRSLLIKLGAVAAAGAAIGTVVALSRGTSSNPPGAK